MHPMSKKEKKPEDVTPEEQTEQAVPTEETEAEAPNPLLEELEALKKSLSDQEDKFLRLAAEYDNYRRRSQKEKESALVGRQGGHRCGLPAGVRQPGAGCGH